MKAIHFCALALLLSGCASQPPAEEALPATADRPAAAPADVGIDWGWRIVGDAAARPVQVFSFREQTYVQMRDRRPVVLLVGGEVVPHVASWPYLIVQGVPDYVDVVLDGYRAVAEHVSQPAAPARETVLPGQVESAGLNRIERVKIK